MARLAEPPRIRFEVRNGRMEGAIAVKDKEEGQAKDATATKETAPEGRKGQDEFLIPPPIAHPLPESIDDLEPPPPKVAPVPPTEEKKDS